MSSIKPCASLSLLRKRRGGNGKPYFGVLTVPRTLPRLLRVPSSSDTIDYVFLHDIISSNAAKLYRGFEILGSAPFRITRNSNLYLEEEEARSLLEAVDSQVAQRRKGEAVRLEIDAAAPPEIVERLVSTFELDQTLVFRCKGPVNLQRLFHLYEETPRSDLKYAPFTQRQVRIGHDADSMFDAIHRQDYLVHHPYESYDAVVNFIHTAAQDPRVLSIKQTLYRTSSDSPIARALLEAATKKEVTVVVELKASFDEATNIRWARSFEDAGVQVSYGLVDLKTHAKLLLIVRNDSRRQNPPLRPSWHRQLQSLHRAFLHGPQPFHRGSRHHLGCSRRFQFSHRQLRTKSLQALAHRASRYGQGLHRPNRSRSAPRPPRKTRAHDRQNERAHR